MAGTSPAMTRGKWFDATEIRSDPVYPTPGLTERLGPLMSIVIPWSFEPAGLQPRKINC